MLELLNEPLRFPMILSNLGFLILGVHAFGKLGLSIYKRIKADN